jgi:hypothetical protein
VGVSIHYIWWGNPGTPELAANATVTPNIMVDAVHGTHDVHYWIGGDKGFDAVLDPRIHQHNIGKNPGQLISGTGLSRHTEKFTKLLSALDGFRAFAATKDLLSFAVMYSQGGYFFDTTTQIGMGYRPHIKRLLAHTNEPCAPYNGSETSGGFSFIPGDESAKFTVAFGGGPSAMYGYDDKVKRTVPAFDVWALYSPKKHHSAFGRALGSYLTRAENVGFLAPSTTTVENFGQPLEQLMNRRLTEEQKKAGTKPPRDQIIGGMAISSLLTGFYQYASDNGKDLKDLGWPYAEIRRKYIEHQAQKPKRMTWKDEEDLKQLEQERLAASIFGGMGAANVTIPMIGIQKWFSGSWRAKNL